MANKPGSVYNVDEVDCNRIILKTKTALEFGLFRGVVEKEKPSE
jgi:hypothetical protein